MRRVVGLICLVLAAAPPAFAQQGCPDGTPPPCRRPAPRREVALPVPGSQQRPYTIIAEFDGTAPAEVRAAAKNLVSSALDESAVIAALPDEQLRLGLSLAGRPETTRVDVATARELAMRGSVRTLVTGTIDQLGQTYHAALRVIEADSNRVVTTRRDIARGEDDLIPTLDRVVRALRANLGERRASIAANRPLEQAATPSFAAYQRYRRGLELVRNLDNLGARAAYKEAVALDPDFAAAWARLAPVYSNLGFADSAESAIAEAVARPGRLTEAQRLDAEAGRACYGGSGPWACLTARARAYRASGGSPVNYAGMLGFFARDSEAVALYEAWARRAPFGLQPVERQNLVAPLLSLGRIDEARRMAESLPVEDRRIWGRLTVASWTGDWTAVDSLAPSFLARGENRPLRQYALVAQASAATARGRVREALGTLDSLGSLNPQERCCQIPGIVLRVVSGARVIGPQPGDVAVAMDSPYGQPIPALRAAAAGDTGTARAIVTHVRALPPERHPWGDSMATLAEAWLAASAGRPAEVVRLLRPLAGQGTPRVDRSLTQAVLWSLAAAYERQNQLDSAAAVLERLAAWQGLHGVLGVLRGLTHSFAHQRLVMLYARMGRPADARRHWQVFSTTFTQPDPEMQHFVDEARAARASAERRP